MRKFERVTGYEDVTLPVRATVGSAGYDFVAAEKIEIPSVWEIFTQISNIAQAEAEHLRDTIDDEALFMHKILALDKMLKAKGAKEMLPTLVPTGIKADMNSDEVLELYLRSSISLKKGLVMANSVGIIDSDYYNNIGNEGHIHFMVFNLGFQKVVIEKGDRIGQGVFKKFLLTEDDQATGNRNGGFGSTSQ